VWPIRPHARSAAALAYALHVQALRTAIPVVWIAFWVYWLASATNVKAGTRSARARFPGLAVVVVLLSLRVASGNGGLVHDPAQGAVGAVVFVCGLGLAVWARIFLGRNWGMPMTRKEEPELVTSGPYRFVRHPIYSGILLALLGTGLAISLYFLIALVVIGPYFLYSAKVEEGLMLESFPTAYPAYRAKTKMLIPFVL
jgi:protein-S-isoprenylcysteine O-methyltransferase Ste14